MVPVETNATPMIRKRRYPSVSVMIAVAMLSIVAFVIVLGPFLTDYRPLAQNLLDRNLGIWSVGRSGTFYILGTDMLGRDLLSRIIAGGRISVLIAIAATLLSAIIGCVLGIVSGYFGGVVDSIITGICDLLMAVPRILFVIAMAAVMPPTVFNLVILLAVTSWTIYARVIRAMTLSLREREFVMVSNILGASSFWTLRKHIFPHVLGQLVILSSFELGNMVMLEAALSYLGLGVQAPDASWGLMINQAQSYISANPKLVVLPGIAIFLLVAGTNFISQAFTHESKGSNVGAGV